MIGIATKFSPTAKAYQSACEAGFRRVELWTDADLLARWSEVAELGRSFAVDHVIHFPNRLTQSPETLSHAACLYRALGCKAMVIHQPHIDRHGQGLLECAPEMRLAVENHKLDQRAFREWAVRNTWLTLDVEHLWKFTLQDAPLDVLLVRVKELLGEFGDKLRHVHLPGYLPNQPEHRPMYCSRDMVLGLFSLLEEIHFEGLIVSEIDVPYQNVREMRMDILLFQHWQALQTAG